MNILTLFGAGAVALMLLSYALEYRSSWWLSGGGGFVGLTMPWKLANIRDGIDIFNPLVR